MEESDFQFQLDALATADDPTRQQALQTLSAHPEETLAKISSSPLHYSRMKAVHELIRHIGYPQNAPILPWLVQRIDRNSWDSKELTATIASFLPAAIAPYIIALLWNRAQGQQSGWGYDMESVCMLLLSLDSGYAALCGPLIAWLFTLKADPRELDPSFLLDVLEHIGPDCAIYALPNLLDYLARETNTENRQLAIRLIRSFDPTIGAPYSQVNQSVIKQL